VSVSQFSFKNRVQTPGYIPPKNPTCLFSKPIGIRDGRGARNSGKKYFLGNYYIKFGHFSGKNHVKFGNFVNFSGKYNKNSGILIIFRARIM